MNKILNIAAILLLFSCNSAEKKSNQIVFDSSKIATPITVAKNVTTITQKTAIINILDTISPKMVIIYMKDSAKTFDRIGLKLAKIYGSKLGEVLKKNNLKMAGAPMAWYKTQKPPYFFEAGVPVTKAPIKMPNTVFVKTLNADSAIVAHFYGPYNLLSQGYDAIKEKMKDEKKELAEAPYEIYIGDPVDKDGKPIDPYKVRTDIVFRIK